MDTFAQNYNAMLAAKREQLLRDRRESAGAAGSPSRSPVVELPAAVPSESAAAGFLLPEVQP